MKKLVTVFTIMFIASCGVAYADDYGVTSNENAIEVSELQGHSYRVITSWLSLPVLPTVFSFDDSGNFMAFERVLIWTPENYSGYYTQTGSEFTAYCEYDLVVSPTLTIPHEIEIKGTILDPFIYGSLTSQHQSDGTTIMQHNNIGFFIGILQELGETVE